MTLEERVCRTVNRLAVVERLLELEGLSPPDVCLGVWNLA